MKDKFISFLYQIQTAETLKLEDFKIKVSIYIFNFAIKQF